MKAFAKRAGLLLFLTIFAVGWVALMSLELSGTGLSEGVDGSQATVTYVDETEFPRVTAYLSVVDGALQPITGLTQAGFALTEDDIPVDIENFIGAGNQPIVALLVIDHSGSMNHGGKMTGAQQAAHTFLDQLQLDRDRIGVIAFDHTLTTMSRVKTLAAEADRQQLKAAISGLGPEGGTAFYDAVYQAVEDIQSQSGRRVVIALTDGIDESSRHWLNETITFIQKHKVPVYTIGLGSDVYESRLQKMADRTGGRYYFSPNASQLAALYKDLANALQNEYSLTYTSVTPRRDGTRRVVGIVVSHPGATLQAAGTYNPGGVLSVTLNVPLFIGLVLVMAGLLLMPSGVKLTKRYWPERVKATPPPPPPPIQPSSHPPAYPSQPPRVDYLQPSPPSQSGQASPTCAHCGHPMRPNAKFCSKCGQPRLVR